MAESFGPVHSVTQTVADLDAATEFYAKVLGLTASGEGEATGPRWHMEAGLTGQYRLMAAPGHESDGLLRLVECSRPGEAVRHHGRIHDPGWFALNYRVDDVAAMYGRALEAGGHAKSPPRLVSDAEFDGGSRIVDSQFFDPDGAVVNVFELSGAIEEAVGALDGGVTPIQTMAIRNADVRTSQAFYEQMGFSVWYDHEIRDRNDFFQIPAGTYLHNVNMMHRPAVLGRIELAGIVGYPGRDISARYRPPNLGYLWTTIPVGDVTGALESLGVEPVARGDAWAFVAGPDGELIELAADIR